MNARSRHDGWRERVFFALCPVYWAQKGRPSSSKSFSCTLCKAWGTHPVNWLPWSHSSRRVGEIAEFRRDISFQLVVAEVQVFQVGEFGGYLAAQLVVVEDQISQVGEVAEFGLDLSSQLVVAEVQVFQAGEVAELGWDRAGQSVVPKAEPFDAAGGVCADAVPFSDWPVAEPVGGG